MPSDSVASSPRKPTARSRVSNGRDILPNVDGRSAVARRYRDIASAILADQGGADLCSESRAQLIRRFAAAACLAEQLEGRLANGEQIDIAEHASLSSTLVRLSGRIGLQRIPRDVEDDLASYLARSYPADRPTEARDESKADPGAGGLGPAAETPLPDLARGAERPSSAGDASA